MLNSKELRTKAWESLKGKYWMAFFVCLVLGILVSIGTSMVTYSQNMTEMVNMVDPAEMDSTMKLGALVISGAALVFALIGFAISLFVGNAVEVGLANYVIKNNQSHLLNFDSISQQASVILPHLCCQESQEPFQDQLFYR